MRKLLIALLAALSLASSPAFADSIIHNLTTTATSPLPANSCLIVDQSSTTDAKLCSGWAAAFGGLTAASNLSDLTNAATARTNLGLDKTANAFLTGAGAGLGYNAVALTGLVLGNGTSAPTAYGGVAAVAHEWISALSAAGVGTLTQPTFADILNQATFGQLPSVIGPVILGRVTNTNGVISGAYTPSNGVDTTVPLVHGVITSGHCTQFSDTSGTEIDSGAPCGTGGTTTITIAPGFTNTVGTQNTGSQTITNLSTLYGQTWPTAETANYSLVSADTGSLLLAAGASSAITFTLPNPATATKGTSFYFGDKTGFGYNLHTVGGTATFYACVGGNPTTLAVNPNKAVQIIDDGANYVCVYSAGGGTAAEANSGTSGHALPFLDGVNTFTGVQTFGEVLSGGRTVSAGTTDTLSAADCGTTVEYNIATGSMTVTMPSGIAAVCYIGIKQLGAVQVVMAAGTGATGPLNPHSYTKTAGQYGVIEVTNSKNAPNQWLLSGDGA